MFYVENRLRIFERSHMLVDREKELDELGLRFVVPLPLVNRDAVQRLSETKVLGKEPSGHQHRMAGEGPGRKRRWFG
jgi:hypothetical protein